MDENSEIDFTSIFGEFEAKATADKKEPLARITQLDEKNAQPCRRCGRYPRIHAANFVNKEAHPKRFYIDCKCGECDGEWYMTENDAVQSWNERHLGASPKDPNVEDRVDFIDKVMENYKIPD